MSSTAEPAPSVARILAEAEARFAAGGYAGTSLSSVARAAGLGNPGLLHHFPSKAALYRAVLEAVGADLDRRLAEAMEGTADARAALRAQLGALADLWAERPAALRLVMHELLDDSGRIERASVLPLGGAVRHAVAAVEAGQDAGVVMAGDPLAIVARLHGTLLYGLLGSTVLGRVHAPPATGWADRLVEAALTGVVMAPSG